MGRECRRLYHLKKRKKAVMKDAEIGQHSLLTRIMAKRCEQCPLCRYARAHPKTRFGQIMDWHGKWCPFWKAQKRVYGAADEVAE